MLVFAVVAEDTHQHSAGSRTLSAMDVNNEDTLYVSVNPGREIHEAQGGELTIYKRSKESLSHSNKRMMALIPCLLYVTWQVSPC